MLDRRPGHESRGQALPFIALALVSLLGLSSLVVNAGYWSYEQRLEQGAADSGAIAGANEIPFVVGSPSPSPVQTLALRDAGRNGFTNGVGGVSVLVHTPPQTGNYVGNPNAVEVIVSKAQPGWLTPFINKTFQTQNVSARSVALRGTAVRNCLVGLDTSNTAITFNNAVVNMPQCGIISDSNFLANGSTITATSVGYVGSNQNIYSNTYLQATPKQASPATDPCPTLPGCAYLKANPPTTTQCLMDPFGGYQNYIYNAYNVTLASGKYCGPIIINGGGIVTFAAGGVFDLEGGLTSNSASAFIGIGITIYNDNGGIILNNNPSVNLSAPSAGNYEGMLIYQPPSNTTGMTVNSGASGPLGSYAGALYLPNATLILNSGTFSTWTSMIAKDIILNSGAAINVPSSAFPGQTVKPSSLVE